MSVFTDMRNECECAACGHYAEGNFSIHQDGFGDGPEVDLCDHCGSQRDPSCEKIWQQISARKAKVEQATGSRA